MSATNEIGLLRWIISIVLPAISGLTGVIVGAFLTARRENINRKHSFIEKQLSEFYSPLLAIRRNLKATGELRVQISSAADSEWRKLFARYEGNPDELRKLFDTKGKAFDKIIDYNNEKLSTEDIPAYHKMIDIFKKYMYLAEPSTVEHFPKLITFVDIWDRFLAETLPGEVVTALGHSEETLYPLYEDLQEQHDILRSKLSNGKL